MDQFRETVELKYRLMPYVYTQAALSSQKGLPLLRPLFLDFPDDPGSWLIEDQYLFGSDLLIAPIFEAGSVKRQLYLPPGLWIDFQTNKPYTGAGWHTIETERLSVIILVRAGTILPQINLAQSTDFMDWRNILLTVYSNGDQPVSGSLFPPGNSEILHFSAVRDKGSWILTSNPSEGRISFSVRDYCEA